MRVLLLTGSLVRPIAPLRLVNEQITVGPSCIDAQASDGRWLSLHTAAASYDLADVLARIPAGQIPEAVVCFMEDGWTGVPRNLRCFAGTKMLLLADNLKKEPDLSGVFRYVGQESFDRVMFQNEQAQLQRFLAGVAPGIPFSLHDAGWPSETPSAQARAI